jgi:hypothetical protein
MTDNTATTNTTETPIRTVQGEQIAALEIEDPDGGAGAGLGAALVAVAGGATVHISDEPAEEPGRYVLIRERIDD